jgi:hypothetical protein
MHVHCNSSYNRPSHPLSLDLPRSKTKLGPNARFAVSASACKFARMVCLPNWPVQPCPAHTLRMNRTSPMPSTTTVLQCATTIVPDANGWVPAGTCGYFWRMYPPSLAPAVLSSAAAAGILVGYLIKTFRKRNILHICAVSISAGLWIAYVLRSVGTLYQQNMDIVAVSDTYVLITPACK